MSNGLAEKDSSWSLNPSPDIPQCCPGTLTDMQQNNQRFSNSGACVLDTQQIQTNHRGFSNSGICALDVQLCSQWSQAVRSPFSTVQLLSRVWLFETPWSHTVHGILQAKTLEWVAFPFSRGSSAPRDRTGVSSIAGRFFTSWATRKAHDMTYCVLFN